MAQAHHFSASCFDRQSNKVLDFEVGDRTKWTYFKTAKRIKEKYNINYLCTDYYESYTSYTIANKHIQTKKGNIISGSNEFNYKTLFG